MAYIKKETAINNLINGNNFRSSNFDNFRDDKEVVLEAVKNYGQALKYTSEPLRNDKEIVLEALKTNGWALEYASNSLKNDKDVVLKAVKTNGLALHHASDKLKNDKEIVLEAVKTNGLALHYASESIQSLCENKDPVETLERVIKAEKLSNDLEKSLSKSQSSTKPKLKL